MPHDNTHEGTTEVYHEGTHEGTIELPHDNTHEGTTEVYHEGTHEGTIELPHDNTHEGTTEVYHEGTHEGTIELPHDNTHEGTTEVYHEGTTEVSTANYEYTVLEPAVYDIDGMGEIIVIGNPYELADKLDDCQGDNIYNFGGDCGLVSVANILTISGMEITEDEIVGRAIDLGLCDYSIFNNPEENGGTTALNRAELLKSYGIDCTITEDKETKGSLEYLAEMVENGHGVNISVNAGFAWNEPSAVGDGVSNHSIIVTGTARDPETGELKGLYVCDSGLTDSESGSLLLTVDELQDCYVDVPGTTAIITNKDIR